MSKKEQGTFTPIPQVSTEEMLEILGGVCLECRDGGRCPNPYCKAVFKAIRALIVAFPEWQKIANHAHDYYDDAYAWGLVKEIRDFGQDKKNEK